MLAFAVFGTMLFANNTDPVQKISLEPQLSTPYSPDAALEPIEYSSEVPPPGPNWCYACAACNGVIFALDMIALTLEMLAIDYGY